MQRDLGDLIVEPIVSGYDFWSLIDELIDDDSGFIHNRAIIADAYKEGNLYGLRVSYEVREQHDVDDPLFCEDSPELLPCFCVRSGDMCDIIWTHSRARRNGFARTLVQKLGIKKTSRQLEESIPFWTAVGLLK
jgi:hypothetical protein